MVGVSIVAILLVPNSPHLMTVAGKLFPFPMIGPSQGLSAVIMTFRMWL